MNIDIICVGKIKEKYLQDAIAEYSKRLSKYCHLNIIELKDEKTPDGESMALDERIKATEGERIIRAIDENAFVFVLDLKGSEMSSPDFSRKIDKLKINGYSKLQFIIGGSLGLSKEVIKKADHNLKFSEMTFPHQLMRVILLEQIYRAFRIMNNEPYHK